MQTLEKDRQETIVSLLAQVNSMQRQEDSLSEMIQGNDEEAVAASRKKWNAGRRKLKSDLKKTSALMKKIRSVLLQMWILSVQNCKS